MLQKNVEHNVISFLANTLKPELDPCWLSSSWCCPWLLLALPSGLRIRCAWMSVQGSPLQHADCHLISYLTRLLTGLHMSYGTQVQFVVRGGTLLCQSCSRGSFQISTRGIISTTISFLGHFGEHALSIVSTWPWCGLNSGKDTFFSEIPGFFEKLWKYPTFHENSRNCFWNWKFSEIEILPLGGGQFRPII